MTDIDNLQVLLKGNAVATLQRDKRKVMRLTYLPEAVDHLGEGNLGLSVPLPITRKTYSGATVTNWIEGLLPEGETRTTLERFFKIRRGDTFRLIQALGRDCAGAVSFVPQGNQSMASASDEPMTHKDVTEAIDDLSSRPLGVDDDVRVSLGGLQSKLLLIKDDDGWKHPTGGRPSTHILKPDPPDLPGLVASEALAQRAATLAGLGAAHVDLTRFGDRSVIIVERYDREVVDGQLIRQHQEDGCQALDLRPVDKYQRVADSGSYRQLAELLTAMAADPQSELSKLAEIMAFTVAIGNTDAHLRNHSLLHVNGTLSLAPIYDAAPTAEFVSTRKLALWVADQPLLTFVTRRHLIAEATGWGLPRPTASELISATCDRLMDTITQAASQLALPNDGIAQRMIDRVTRLRKSPT